MKFFASIMLFTKIILVLALVAFGMYFALINKQLVTFDLLLFTVPSINLGLLIMLSLLIGILLGIFASSVSALAYKKRR